MIDLNQKFTKGYIEYTQGWKYRLNCGYKVQTNIFPPKDINTEYVALLKNGMLYVDRRFCFDGPSGELDLLGIIKVDITRDTHKNMRGSCGHDAISYLMRMGLLDPEWFMPMNQLFLEHLIQDGFWVWLAHVWKKAVSKLRYYISPEYRKKVYRAPKETL